MHKLYKSKMPFYLLWILITSFGASVGFVFGGAQQFSEKSTYFVQLIFTGLLIGLGQWLLMSSKAGISWVMIPATMIGLPLSCFIAFSFGESFSRTGWSDLVVLFAICSLAGAIIGAIQLTALSTIKISEGMWWIAISALGWGIAFTAASASGAETGAGNFAGNLSFGAILGLVLGIVSGAYMIFALYDSQQTASVAQHAS